MSDVGRLSDGQKEIQRLQDAGFSGPEIQQYQADQTATLRAGGFDDGEVQAYWGQPSPDPTPSMRRAADYGAPQAPELNDVGEAVARPATSTWEAIQAGWQNSVIGLLARGKEADLNIDPEQTPFIGQVMGSLVQAGVDMPSIVLGGRMAPGAGASPTGITGRVAQGSSQGAVAMGLPDFERRLLIDHYRNGDYTSVEDFGARWWKALQESGSAAAGGAAFGPAGELGRIAEGALTRAGVPTVTAAVARATTVATSGAVAAEGIDATLSNRDFSVHGFIVNAVSILGLELGGHYVGSGRNRRFEPGDHAKHVAENMMDIYARTGVSPADQVRMAAEDPAVRAEILGRNVDGDTVSPTLNATAPPPEMRGEQPEAPPAPTGPRNAQTIRDEHDADMLANDTQAYNIAAIAARARRGTMGAPNTDVGFFVDQERSAAYAARHGISPDDVVSPAGAIGVYQIMPALGRGYGYTEAQLHDPAINRHVAELFHADLVRRFPRDPEAQIVAYIAGPDKAYHWIQSGRNDRTLGPNTRAYLAHGRTRLGIEGDQLPEIDQANYRASDQRQSGDADWMPPEPSYEDLTREEEPVDIGGGGGEQPPDEPPRTGGEGQRRLPPPREEVFKLNEDSLSSLIREHYAPEAKEPFYRRLNPMRIISDFKSELSHVETTQTASDQLNVRDMLRQRYASAERAGMFIDSGPIDALTLDPIPGPSYKDAFRAVKDDGGTLEGFRDYRNAARTGELAEREIESGIDPQVAARFVHLTKGKYERGAQTLARMKDSVVDYVRDSGRYSAEGAENMKGLNRYHISMRRAVDPSYVPPGARPRGRFGNTKKIKGSDRLFMDQDVADMDNITHQIAMADHNRAVVSFVEAWKKGELIEVDLTLDAKSTAAMQKLLPDSRKPRGKVDVLDADGKPIPDPEAAAQFQQETELQRAENTLAENKFVIYKDGRPEVWEFKGDPNVFRILTYPGFAGKDNPLLRIATGVAKFMRSGVATTASFIERVFVRNELEDFVTGKDAGAPFQDFVGGIMSVIKADKFYQDARAKGAIGTSLADIDRRYLKTQAADIFQKRGIWRNVWNRVNPYNWPEAARMLQRAHDSSRRVGMMKRLVRKGVPPVKAAMATREGYMDLVEPLTGDWVNTWSRMAVFMRTSVKSIERMAETAVERPGTFALRGIAGITVPTVLNYFMNKWADQYLPDDEKYANVPQWERDLFWVLPPVKIGDTYIRIPIPRPYTVGFVFATVPERALETMWEHDPRALREFGKTFMQQWMFPFTPALATPWLEDISNTSFTGAPLVPRSLAEASGYMQYKPDTSETGKALSRLLSPEVGLLSKMHVGFEVSPIVLDNYLKGWTGSLPYQVLKVLETPWHYDGRPWEAANLPLVGVFIMRNPGAGAQPIQDFYSEYDRVTAAHRDLKLAIEHQDMSEIHDAASLKAFLSISGVAMALRQQSASLHAIERNKDLSNDEKQKYTDALYSAMLATARGGLQAIDALDNVDGK